MGADSSKMPQVGQELTNKQWERYLVGYEMRLLHTFVVPLHDAQNDPLTASKIVLRFADGLRPHQFN